MENPCPVESTRDVSSNSGLIGLLTQRKGGGSGIDSVDPQCRLKHRVYRDWSGMRK